MKMHSISMPTSIPFGNADAHSLEDARHAGHLCIGPCHLLHILGQLVDRRMQLAQLDRQLGVRLHALFLHSRSVCACPIHMALN